MFQKIQTLHMHIIIVEIKNHKKIISLTQINKIFFFKKYNYISKIFYKCKSNVTTKHMNKFSYFHYNNFILSNKIYQLYGHLYSEYQICP